MINKLLYILCCLLFVHSAKAQKTADFTADYIKSAAFTKDSQSVNPFFELGESFSIEFDDLYGNEGNYFYRVKAYNYDWTPSKLKQIEYIKGMENQRIKNYVNSYNTLQSYTHYKLTFPNAMYRITKSGNYILEIYDEDNEVVIRRKFILYETMVNVPSQVKRTRNLKYSETKQNVDFTIKLGDAPFQNPVQNIKVAIFQNGRWDSYIKDIKPMYTIGTDLIYKYDGETQFWAGNQFLYFDNSDIRQVNNMIFSNKIENGIYNTYLYTNESRRYKGYTYFPDINGAFYPRIIGGKNANAEAEYSWVYFSFKPDSDMPDGVDYYITGMFNGYELTPSSKMAYNTQKEAYEKAILLKQGFTNYSYTAVFKNKVNPELNPDGNYALTTNQYQIIVYYKSATDLYDRVIGFAEANAKEITY
ncbi:type IX secretion system plug protein [Myroides indicus]|uniref:Uncharacterized protein DUF5103 n=1 Tax=Myroides indicus TaxID=1323422 RepID=A0A4R7EY49_9FLAO|nr:DUF5103 domain-containing protein [Myroides indicus]TDS60164.1 uncharacterized protein DUF5103 [Myroides indicus]